jgi:hypothetical protein
MAMHILRKTWLLAALGLACGAKDETTVTDGSDTGAATTTTGDDSTTGDPDPTTSGSSSSGGESSSSSGGESSTGDVPACETSADDCGVSVTEDSSFCPDMPPAKDELVLEPLGPGKIKITEIGRDSACNITIGSEVILGSMKTLIVNYVINGNPDDGCQCKHEVTSTVSGLQSGTWSVLVGSYEGKVDVP